LFGLLFFLSLNERPHTRRSGKVKDTGNTGIGKGENEDFRSGFLAQNCGLFSFTALRLNMETFERTYVRCYKGHGLIQGLAELDPPEKTFW
jgi:hypothetical protein